MTETLRAIDALLARRPTTPPPLATVLAEEDEEGEGAESVDGTLSQLLHAEAAAEEAEAAEAEEAEAVAVAEVEAEAVQPVASAPSVGRGFTRTEAPNTAPSTAPSSGEAACARLLGELGELQSPALGELQSPAIELQSPALGELQSPVLELQSPALELGKVAIRGSPGEGSSAQYSASAVVSAVEEDELVYQGGGASQASQGGGASQGSQGSRERGVARFGIGLSVEGAVEGAEDEAPASLRQLRQLRHLGAEDEAIGERTGALGGAGALGGEADEADERAGALGDEDGEGAAGPSLADSYADETLDDEAHEWRETLELLIPALPRLPPEQVSLVNRL